MSNFGFLLPEWPDVHEAATKAEAEVNGDPRTACFYARRALELAVAWVSKADESLTLPYQHSLSALIHDPAFKVLAGEAVFSKARLITRLGNQAVHSHRPIPTADAVTAVRELYHVSYWLARTYGRRTKPGAQLSFDMSAIPPGGTGGVQSAEKLQELETRLHERNETLTALLVDQADLDAELVKLRAEITVAKKENASQADTHDYSEAQPGTCSSISF